MSLGVVLSPDAARRVLLVKLSSLGDIVHALPLLEALREGLGPDAFLSWAVRDKFADLLHGNPHVSQVYPLAGSGVGDLWRFGLSLQKEQFDAALDTQGLLVSGIVIGRSGAPLRIGFDWNREGNRLFLTHPVVPARGQRLHVVDRLMAFCETLGIPRVAPRPQMYLAKGETEAANALLQSTGESVARDDSGPRVGFIVGASTADKVWPIARWAQAARLLSAQGVRVVLLGGRGTEIETAAAIEKQASGAVAANITGKTTLPVLASILAQCDVVVGGDSGPTHLAVAVGTPVVGLYGVTDPARTGPQWGAAPAVILDYAEKDAPPENRRPRHATLPDALARIPAEAVDEAVRGLLIQVGQTIHGNEHSRA